LAGEELDVLIMTGEQAPLALGEAHHRHALRVEPGHRALGDGEWTDARREVEVQLVGGDATDEYRTIHPHRAATGDAADSAHVLETLSDAEWQRYLLRRCRGRDRCNSRDEGRESECTAKGSHDRRLRVVHR